MDLQRLGNRIRQAREQLGLSQEAFAARVSKTQTAVSEYENGNRRISITEIPKFAEVLQVPIMYFFEDNLNPTDRDFAVLEVFHKLSPASQQDAIRILHILIDIDARNHS